MKTTMIRRLASVAALTVGLLAAAQAPAAASDVPADVAAWFEQDAARVASEVLGSGDSLGTYGLSASASFEVGAPVQLHTWTEVYLESGTGAPAVSVQEWVAPMTRGGRVVGTIAATRAADGTVAFLYVDDDAPGGQGLAAGGFDKVVHDDAAGGLIALGDGSAHGLSKAAQEKIGNLETPAKVRAAVIESHDPKNWAPGEGSGAATSTELPAVQAVSAGVGLVLLAGGVVFWLRGRRPAQDLSV